MMTEEVVNITAGQGAVSFVLANFFGVYISTVGSWVVLDWTSFAHNPDRI